MEACYGLARSEEPMGKTQISNFIDRSEPYTKALIHLGSQIGVVVEEGGKYSVDNEVEDNLKTSLPEQRFVILNKSLQQYQPFLTFLSFLSQGYSSKESSRKVKAIYGFELKEDDIDKQFTKLGTYADLIEPKGDSYKVAIEEKTLTDTYVNDLKSALESEASTRLFLQNQLDEKITNYMEEETFEELVEALLRFENSPRNAIAGTGRAVEDFQRKILNDFGQGGDLNYEDAKGIGQLGEWMHQQEEWSEKRHLHGASYLGGMRNPSGGHGKDPKSLERWEVNPEIAFDYILASIHYIRSIYESAKNSRKIL